MAEQRHEPGFFVGWASVPKGLAPYLWLVTLAAIGLGIGFGAGSVLAMRDPGEGSFRWDLGRQELSGRLEVEPYPVLYTEPSDTHPHGRAIFLVGGGKTGVRDWAAPLAGQAITAAGILITHNGHEMMAVGQAANLSAAAEGVRAPAPSTAPLGQVTLEGEVVDSKCALGAMRPGDGKAHKGCANLCLTGDIPGAFMVFGPDQTPTFLLLTGPDGERLPPEAFHPWTGLQVELTGEAERVGGLLVLRTDLAQARVL